MYIYTYVHIYIYVCIIMCIYTYYGHKYTRGNWNTHSYKAKGAKLLILGEIPKILYLNIHVHINTYMETFINIYIHVYLHTQPSVAL